MMLHAGVSPLSRHVLFQSTDLDCAREQVARKFCRHKLEIVGDRRLFHTRHHYVMGNMMSLNYIDYGADVLIDPGALNDFYLIQIPLDGFADIKNGNRTVAADRSTGSVLNPQWETRMRWFTGCRQILLQVKKAPFQAFANRVFDRDLPGEVMFDPRIDLTRPEMVGWLRLVASLYAAIDDGEANVTPQSLMWHLTEQRIIELFLQAQPSNVAIFAEAVTGSPTPRHLKRARAFIRDNAHRPITLIDIAEAAGCSTRTLQSAFQSTYGSTPLRVLRDERLRRVRFELTGGENVGPGMTIADVAMKWGFHHLSRFSAEYRAAFGELPRETLHG
jgi:AraC-like DNA-binding protein